jgi:hypothetical protein
MLVCTGGSAGVGLDCGGFGLAGGDEAVESGRMGWHGVIGRVPVPT